MWLWISGQIWVEVQLGQWTWIDEWLAIETFYSRCSNADQLSVGGWNQKLFKFFFCVVTLHHFFLVCVPRKGKALGSGAVSCEPQKRPFVDQKCSQHRKQAPSMPPLQPQAICKLLAQPLCPAPGLKISYVRPPLSVSKWNYYAESLCVRGERGLGSSILIPVFCKWGNGGLKWLI